MKEYLIPDYYTEFKCKMGACRSSCCEGWQVAFSLEDYFRITAEDCSKELRDKIDRGVKVSLHPTPQTYAYIQHDYFGNCPMRLEDGRCGIHAELGENALATVCKLYPRGIRIEPVPECSCANSCEGTLEILFAKDEPIKFIKKELDIEPPKGLRRVVNFNTMGKELEIRKWLIGIIQNRRYSLTIRLMKLGLALKSLKEVLDKRNPLEIEELFKKEFIVDDIDFNINSTQLQFGLTIAEELLRLIDENSNSVRGYGEEALLYFGNDENTLDRYIKGKKEFERKIPKWEIWFEHMLTNHLFFEQFPFQDRPEEPWEEFVAVCSVYAILRFLGIGWMANKNGTSDFIDMASAVFRLVDHTSFDRYSAHMLKELNCDTPQKIFDLITL